MIDYIQAIVMIKFQTKRVPQSPYNNLKLRSIRISAQHTAACLDTPLYNLSGIGGNTIWRISSRNSKIIWRCTLTILCLEILSLKDNI
jgi:hypothetical protein